MNTYEKYSDSDNDEVVNFSIFKLIYLLVNVFFHWIKRMISVEPLIRSHVK